MNAVPASYLSKAFMLYSQIVELEDSEGLSDKRVWIATKRSYKILMDKMFKSDEKAKAGMQMAFERCIADGLPLDWLCRRAQELGYRVWEGSKKKCLEEWKEWKKKSQK